MRQSDVLPPAGRGRSGFIPYYSCQIRESLGDLIEGEDIGWALNVPVAELGLLMTEAFRRHALPFLDRFPDRKAVRALWEQQPDLVPFLGPARFDLAIMAAHEGDHTRAMELIQAHYDETIRKGRRGHADYVEGVAAHLGYALKTHSPGAES